MGIFSWIIIIIFFWLAINAGFLIRYRILAGKLPSNKLLIVSNGTLLIVTILFIILPKSNGDCNVNIIIDNKNSNSNIVINKEYTCSLNNNEIISLDNLKHYGTIAIKTENEAVIVAYFDDNHLLKLNHKINIIILNNQISIDSFPKLSIGIITDDINKYENIIELFK